jgi:signal transduction histidine kinase
MNAGDEQVLLIEDDLCEAKLFRRLIQRESNDRFIVHHVSTLEAAIKKLEDRAVTLVLTDLNLPDSQGVETFKIIHSARPEIAVVILSGDQDEQLAIDTVQHGAQDYLVKGRDNGSMIVRALIYALERKRVSEEWRRLMTMRDQERRLEALGVLSSGLAHEINTPLQFVGTNVEFLKKAHACLEQILEECDKLMKAREGGKKLDKALDAVATHLKDPMFAYMRPQMGEVINETAHGIERVHSIVKAMRVFSRHSNGERVRYDVNRAVRDAVMVSRNEWKNCAEMTMNLDETIPGVSCVPEEISQCILNLLTNAAHAVGAEVKKSKKDGHRERGAIDVSTTTKEGTVEILVADTGGGIPEDVKSRIFEPFFTTKDVGSGTGQGLALVRQIVQNKHGGTISFESRDGGSVFRVVLPIDTPESVVNEEISGNSINELDGLDARLIPHLSHR